MNEHEYTPRLWVAEVFDNIKVAKEVGLFEWCNESCLVGKVGAVWKKTKDGQTGLPGSVETSAANACLIAAAPDLLEACKFVQNALTTDCGFWDMLKVIEAAITKAEGGEA